MLLRFASALLLGCSTLMANVVLPPIFSDHAVLQKSDKVPVWGQADPGEKVTVTVAGVSQSAMADDGGKWQVSLDLSQAGPGPFSMTVAGKNTLEIADVVVGEVWLASGQSNMEWSLRDSANYEEAKAAPANPLLREFRVDRAAQHLPTSELRGYWQVATPETVGNFSGVSYGFSERLQRDLGVPVGMIVASWGGTPVETWTDLKSIEGSELKASAAEMRRLLANHPAQKAGFTRAFTSWVKRTGREDQPTPDANVFVTGDTADWVDVTIPGTISAPGLSETGVIWFRTDVEVAPENAGGGFAIGLGPLVGYETVYWNGERVGETTLETYQGKNFYRWIYLPGDKMKAGKNTLAIRVYAPGEAVSFPGPVTVGWQPAPGPWKAKAEKAFPALAEDQRAPQPPSAPPRAEDTAAYLYNGMIHPLIPYAIKGAIWYQGESNAQRAYQYRTSFPLMIEGWRAAWGQGNFPFYFAQLANFQVKDTVPGESDWAELREAQSMALALPNTGQAMLIDLGEANDIHPRNKKDVGDRLARLALARDYGKPVTALAPSYKSLEIKGDEAVVHFDLHGTKLVAQPVPATQSIRSLVNQTAPLVRNRPDSELEGFAICGQDRRWVWADARIDGDSVVVSSPEVKDPVAVRYGWSMNPTCNLYGGDGLPVSPFRTDDFPAGTLQGRY